MTENVDTENTNDMATGSDSQYDYDGGDDKTIVDHLQWALFVILILVVLVATFQFYFAASSAIDQFVTGRYRSIFQAGFNLAILLVSGLGLSLLVRNMR
ncbi:hypothetical protein SAMN05216559_3202 [Halomicrobium zhouii]|uniref:DUF8060 domain-containing protein n=1 Tax=Halomicrobium zhouii TaxID=767519 RepID=A0A1I6LV30_9EURY|nr:hypothetical protein [Halomicrobium zhouii]SFS07351.1 hypothetical protein SAMN05216559_3202 [Halomicrobium zhouii]